jgi:phage terminase large subunit
LIRVYSIANEFWIEEILYSSGLRNVDIIREMKANQIPLSAEITADSADPKSIDDINIEGGYKIKGARKGADSIQNGIDRILSKKVFITRKSVNLITEFENYCWKPSGNGSFLSEPIDDYNHGVDGIRYSIEQLYTKGIQIVQPIANFRR